MPIDPHLFAAFVLTAVVAMLVPGPDMLFVLGCGIRGGARAGLLATAGRSHSGRSTKWSVDAVVSRPGGRARRR
ncbi:hypothetical protein [Actinokineospora enzanensis]|uniref:hypothetical protein n=1 Tax=Actinokineospora enzanensis TaxID=155975 RepID=UPI0003A9A3AE|nr:hypothetical protein [Actinokineospora enzanensis]